MGIHYNRKKNRVYIAWDEKKNDGVEHWHGDFTPINVFYHPINTNEIVRVKLKGKIPKWVERFSEENQFKSGESSDSNGKRGFWLANWRAWTQNHIPISAPNLNGAINQFIKMIPDELVSIKKQAKDNAHIIKTNLNHNPKFFEDIGVYYKPEEIEGGNGTLLIENEIFLDKGNLSDEEYAKSIELDGKLEKVIWELTTEVPVPEEDIVEEESELDLEELVFEDDLLENISFETEELILEGFEETEDNPESELIASNLTEVEEIILFEQDEPNDNISDSIFIEENDLIIPNEEKKEIPSVQIEEKERNIVEPLKNSVKEGQVSKKTTRSRRKKKDRTGETIPLF